MPPIYIVNGTPAAGKSTLSRSLMARYERGVHIEVDVLREWVVSGIAHPMDWTEETIRQFRLAEEAAIDVAIRYQEAGFAVAVDHCRRLEDWDEVLDRRCAGRPLVRVVLQSPLEVTLKRNAARLNKDFEPSILDRLIRGLDVRLLESAAQRPHWNVVSNGEEGIQAATENVFRLGEALAPASPPPLRKG